ncbi:MAG: YdcF family protein [Moorea sp. SIO2B7]|nr:YdcF family protein [Moorena sp. SIO2B7]
MSFVFLSKLLPLFFYPLGLACVLLIFALLLWWKNSRWLPIPVALALLLLLLGGNGWLTNSLVRSLEWQNIPAAEMPTAEAIVLLGGATKSAYLPRPMVDVKESGDRVLYAAKLYRDQKAPLIIASGGRVKWQGGEKAESADMAQLLEMMGVPHSAIIQEPNSLNTYQNAVNVRQILEKRGIKRVLLVTSAMHMPRSLLIFKRQGIEAIPAPTDFLVSEQEIEQTNNSKEAIILNILPNADRLATTTKALKEYIGTVVYRLRGWL